jgi:hypothetical protein
MDEEQSQRLLSSETESPLEINGIQSVHALPQNISPFHIKYKQRLLRIDDESHQYEDDENEVWWHHQLQR